jgi:hypothetical protein
MTNFENWFINFFDREEIDTIYEHGCVGGIGGITYYYETCAIFKEHSEDIMDLIFEELDDYFGQDENVFYRMSQLNGAENVGSWHQMQNFYVWFACEILASRHKREEEEAAEEEPQS